MKFKYLIIIILFIIVVLSVSFFFSQHKKAERAHVKVSILLYHDFVSTVPDKDPDFIVTDKIGKEINGRKYLSWEQCVEMQNSGLVEFFSHSKRHVFYDKLPVRAIRDDVLASYKSIESHLGSKDLKVFAYPYGAYTSGTVWTLKLNGINMQIYDLGMNYFDEFNTDYIKRINVPCEMTGKKIIEEIQNIN